jgi:hypothetical protein
MRQLSERAMILLAMVKEHTEYESKVFGQGELSRFFVPPHNGNVWVEALQQHEWLSGGGDASAFRGLEGRGLIKRPRTALPNKYVYYATEEGVVVYDKIVWPYFESRRERKGEKVE